MTRCKKIWNETGEALLKTTTASKRSADQNRRGATTYVVGQQVWLSTKDIQLKNLPRKMAPHFIGPYTVEKIINPAAVRLKLPQNMRIRPTFHVSQVKPVEKSDLCPPPQNLHHPI